jgi:hypothetical protein
MNRTFQIAALSACFLGIPHVIYAADSTPGMVDDNNNVTWTHPSSAHTPYKLSLNKGDTFQWTNGSEPGPGPGKQVFTPDTLYDGFTVSKSGDYYFFFPKDPKGKDEVSDILTKTPKGDTIHAAAVTDAGINPRGFTPLENVPDIRFSIPWFASLGSGPNIYMGVDLPAYIKSNPDAIASGIFSNGQSIADLGVNIVDGQIPGVTGLYFATSELGFNPNSPIGFEPLNGSSSDWLNSNAYQAAYGPIGVIGSLAAIPEPPIYAIMLASLAILFGVTTRRHKSEHHKRSLKKHILTESA